MSTDLQKDKGRSVSRLLVAVATSVQQLRKNANIGQVNGKYLNNGIHEASMWIPGVNIGCDCETD